MNEKLKADSRTANFFHEDDNDKINKSLKEKIKSTVGNRGWFTIIEVCELLDCLAYQNSMSAAMRSTRTEGCTLLKRRNERNTPGKYEYSLIC
jgi:hypothetical protein